MKAVRIMIGAMLAIALTATAAIADSEGPVDFGAWNTADSLTAQDGWAYTGGDGYDVAIVDSGIDGKSLRISNSNTSGSFGDWLFSKPLSNPGATEVGDQVFTAEYDIESATGSYQENLQVSVSPTRSDGARMTYLKFRDTPEGIVVSFADVMNLDEVVGYYPAEEDWREVDIATLSYTEPHHIKTVINLIPGEHNDVVQVYIDDSEGLVPGRTGEPVFDGFYAPVDNQPTINKAKAGQTIPLKWRLAAPSFATTWEDYYRYNTESNGGQNVDPTTGPFDTRPIDSLIFQARSSSGGDPDNDGNGYFFDNVSYASTDDPSLPVTTTGVSDASVYNNPPITVTGEQCDDLDGNIDPIEVYAANAGGLMYHGNGVWQYNWQTPKTLAKHCVRVTLDPVGGSTNFKFTK